MSKLINIEGIGEIYAAKLKACGIQNQQQLLNKGSTPQGRNQIAEATGISKKLILNWVNRADLERIKGIGEEYSDLLENAGVDTVVELSQRNPHKLYIKVLDINRAKHFVRHLPGESQINQWVQSAKQLPRAVNY